MRKIIAEHHSESPRYISNQIEAYLTPHIPQWAKQYTLHLDHIVPMSHGGTNDPENLGFLPPSVILTGGGRAAQQAKLEWWGSAIWTKLHQPLMANLSATGNSNAEPTHNSQLSHYT